MLVLRTPIIRSSILDMTMLAESISMFVAKTVRYNRVVTPTNVAGISYALLCVFGRASLHPPLIAGVAKAPGDDRALAVACGAKQKGAPDWLQEHPSLDRYGLSRVDYDP